MKLAIHGKQLDIGESLRAHIERGIPTLVGKYFDNPTDATVTVAKEGQAFRTDITVHVGKGILVQGHAQSSDPYAAFDTAGEHVAKRLRRYKRRLRDHHRGHNAKDDVLTAAQYVLAAETELAEPEDEATHEPDQPIVIAEMEALCVCNVPILHQKVECRTPPTYFTTPIYKNEILTGQGNSNQAAFTFHALDFDVTTCYV